MSTTFNPVGGQNYTLQASIGSTDTTITLTSFTEPVSGTPYTMANMNTDIAYGTIAPRTSSSEFISFTGITQNADGTATLTGVTRGLQKKYPFTSSATFKLPHSGQSIFILSDAPQLFNKYSVIENDETITGEKTFSLLPRSTAGNATDGDQLITYAQALALATGTASINRVVVAGNAGEIVSAGNLLYLLVSDGKWYKADADTASQVDNVILGIAQGAGTNGNPITNGILLFGLDSNQTGLTTNTAYYAGNTAGVISSTPGTVEVSVGVSRSTTSILFYPRYNQQLTEDQQDALVGTSGTPSATNKYVTNDDTATAATANKVARRLAGGNITIVTESQGNNSTNAASTAYVDTALSNLTTKTPAQFLSYAAASTANATCTTAYTGFSTTEPLFILGGSTGVAGYITRCLKRADGSLVITHTATPTGSSNNAVYGFVLGSYLYVVTNNAGTATVTRYDKADLANATTMTISGTAFSSSATCTDGTKVYNTIAGNQVREYTLSGTTLTSGSTVSYTSIQTVLGTWCDGTYIYQIDTTGATYKYTIGNSARTTGTGLYTVQYLANGTTASSSGGIIKEASNTADIYTFIGNTTALGKVVPVTSF